MSPQEKAALVQRYTSAAHAMQSGVKTDMLNGSTCTEPKHLRVGINTSKVDQGALATLLIEAGVFSEKDYLVALSEAMEREVAEYEARLSKELGVDVKLA